MSNLVFGQSDDYQVTEKLYSFSDGFPDTEVFCGVQDKHGFLWFGTRNGVWRYDGREFKLFTKKKNGLRGLKVIDIVTDGEDGVVLIYGILGSSFFPDSIKDVIDINTLKVLPINNYYPKLPVREGKITSILKEVNGSLYIGSDFLNKRWRYTSNRNFTEKSYHNLKYKVFNFGKIDPLVKSRNVRNLSSSHVILYEDSTMVTSFIGNLTNSIKGRFFHHILEDGKAEERYFVSTAGKLRKLDPKSLEFKIGDIDALHHTVSRNDPSFIIYNLEGINYFILNFNKKIRLFESLALKNVRVNAYFMDAFGSYWLCTTKGLIKLRLTKNKFEQQIGAKFNPTSTEFAVRGIYVDAKFTCFNFYDFIYVNMDKKAFFFKGNENYALEKIGSDLWIGGYGLNLFNPKTGKIELKARSISREIWSIFELNKDQLLLGCSDGIDIYTKSIGSIVPANYGNFVRPNFIYRFIQERKDRIWAIADNGIYVLNNKGEVIDCYAENVKNKKKRLPCASIHDGCIDKSGVFWLASGDAGLIRWDRTNNTFKEFGLAEGLLSLTVNTILEDDYNNLWLGTDYGLVKFNKATNYVKSYTIDNGIVGNEFNRGSSFKAKNGTLYFGGVLGVTSFNPKVFEDDKFDNNCALSIVSCWVSDRNTNQLKDNTGRLLKTHQLTLYEKNDNFTLTYSLLDFETRKHLYAYKIIGLDKSWNYLDESSFRIGRLPYGEYILKIKGQNATGKWNKQEISIRLVVVRPFYKTWWFICISLSGLIVLIILGLRRRLKALEKANSKLEKIVVQRTQQINTSLNEKVALIQEIHHRVKNNLQFITAMLEMQVDANKSEKEKNVLLATSRRINAITLVHEMLYNRDDLEKVSLEEYLKELISKMNEFVNESHLQIKFNISIEPVYFNINNCVAIGMITSEIMSNSIKYAFDGVVQPEISIRLKRDIKRDLISYTIQDNGVFNSDSTFQKGFGLRLVDIFSRQLKGTFTIKQDSGFLVEFEFKLTQD